MKIIAVAKQPFANVFSLHLKNQLSKKLRINLVVINIIEIFTTKLMRVEEDYKLKLHMLLTDFDL